MTDEGIRTATEIGDINRIKPRILINDLPGREDLLSVSPVHLLDLFGRVDRLQRKEVHWNGKNSQIPQFLRYLEVNPGIAGVIGPSNNDHHLFIRSDLIQDLFAPVEKRLVEEGLKSLCLLKGLLHPLRSPAEGLSEMDQLLLQMIPSEPEVEDGLKHSPHEPS